MEVLPAEGSNSGDGLKEAEKALKMNGAAEGMEVDEVDEDSQDSEGASDESVCGSSRVGANTEQSENEENEENSEAEGKTNSHNDDVKSNSHFESEGEGEGKSNSHFESEGEGKSNSHFGSEYGGKNEGHIESMDVDGLADGDGESINSEEEDHLLNSDIEEAAHRAEEPGPVEGVEGVEGEDELDEETDDEEGDINGDPDPNLPEKEGGTENKSEALNGEITPKKKKVPAAVNLTPRRSSRTVQKPVRFGQEPLDSDEEEEADANADSDGIEEIQQTDPLADPLLMDKNRGFPRMIGNTTIVVSDAKRLAEMASLRTAQQQQPKKEPTLVIIDTNSILSGRGAIPMQTAGGVTISQHPAPAKAYPPPMQPNYPPKPKPPQILPSLTDDMYVVEAPSFIVPYVYEKPPVKKFKKYLRKMLKQVRKQEEERQAREDKEDEEAEKLELEKLAKLKNEPGVEPEKESEIKEEKMEVEVDGVDIAEDKIKLEANDPPEAVSEEVKEKKDEEETGDKEDTDKKVDVKEEKEETPAVEADKEKEAAEKKPEIPEVKKEVSDKKEVEESSDSEDSAADEEDEKKKTPGTGSYFANPLGKFFMTIGMNLVQEFVQTDLLKQQKKKQKAGKGTDETQAAIASLKKNLQLSRENNEPYTMHQAKCEFCSFKTESKLIMAHHLETPHMRNYVYRCNFCPLEVRGPHDILLHMEAEHMVRGRLERAPAFHQCPQCPFEDNQKGKLTRHLLTCAKKFRPEKNLEPPLDWEPPAKIPRVPRKTSAMPPNVNNPIYQQAMAAKNMQHALLPKMGPGMSPTSMLRPRGRPAYSPLPPTPNQKMTGGRAPLPPQLTRGNMMYRPPNSNNPVMLPSQYQIPGGHLFQVMGPQGQMMSVPGISGGPPALQRLGVPPPSQQQKNPATVKLLNQPSISITPLPRQPSNPQPGIPPQRQGAPSTSKTTFVICEICDGYIKDLEQLRNHMQWIHKVKIHPKMIYNRPPLNCQKCQFRFFTDQGLERHLLGSHGLVTSSMQDSANKGKDGGRCPVCGRVYQWKLLNHVARDHNMTLKPAHLSYKCTVCTATFGMYKQFESHVYSAHSVVAKRVMDKKNGQAPATTRPDTATLLKPLKINDEITIIPQPAKKPAAQQQRPVPGNYRVNPASAPQKARGPDSVQVIDLEDSPHKGGENGSESLTAVKERLRRRKSLEIRQLESEPEPEASDSDDAGPQDNDAGKPTEEDDDDRDTDPESEG